MEGSWLTVLWWTHAVAAVVATGHATLVHRQARGAALWITLIWMVPWLGPLLYLLLGVNRIPRPARARRLLVELSDFHWSEGNEVVPLVGGDAAYPAMIDAIEGARESVSLSTYIFDDDRAGAMFRDALTRAVRRGVEVRVLVDAIGAQYSRPPIITSLRAHGVTTARFLPTRMPWRWPYANLRNHRKLLVVDDRLGFIGGMNIRESCMLSWELPRPTRDLHFSVAGPIVRDMALLFASDWAFSTGELLAKPPLPAPGGGGGRARLVYGGPDRADEPIRWSKLAAVVRAASRVRIMTPYFVPDEDVVTALCAAASAGVQVQIILPSVNNLRLVAWASRGTWLPLLARGIELRLSPPPFEHTKLMVIDDDLAIIGSSNWDERSFRLNFECDIECRDEALVASLRRLLDERVAASREVTLDDLRRRSLAAVLRDRTAWLALPYL
ncbi:MAG: PLDc N-terminal domain-containing protein [Myxococcales bacterium]|nr:PLDc N-terminal domain-containing protein [Myxococcales bacterium]MCB9714711.1 PLDc N-terminal domain-containing protein [Myxococcales bacterium]